MKKGLAIFLIFLFLVIGVAGATCYFKRTEISDWFNKTFNQKQDSETKTEITIDTQNLIIK